MNLSSIDKTLFKIFSLPENKGKPDFTIGEVLKGEVLEKAEKWLLVNLGEKGIVKAFSDLDFSSKEIFLKVISLKPEVVLKALPEKNIDVLNFIENFKNKNVTEALKNLPENIKEKVLVTEKDLGNPILLKNKIKELPINFGVNLEKSIIEKETHKDSFKFNLSDSSNKHITQDILNLIHTNRKINNDFQFLIPLFFQNRYIKKGSILFKKKDATKNNKKPFSIVIFLELTEERKLQINLTAVKKELSLSFLSNDIQLVKMLSNDFLKLAETLKNYGYKILSYNFKTIKSLDNDETMLNLLLENNKFNIIDIKT